MIIIGAIGDRVELLYDINTSKGKFKKGTIGELFKTYASQNEFNIELYLPAQSVGSRKYNVYEKFKREDVRFICNEFQVGDIVKIVRRYPMAYFGTSGKIVGKSRFPFVYRVKIYGEQLYRDFAGEELELVENLSIINVGDIVSFEQDNNLIIHRVVEITSEGLITKGDNNRNPDQAGGGIAPVIKVENVKGRAVLHIPMLGYVKIIYLKMTGRG